LERWIVNKCLELICEETSAADSLTGPVGTTPSYINLPTSNSIPSFAGVVVVKRSTEHQRCTWTVADHDSSSSSVA